MISELLFDLDTVTLLKSLSVAFAIAGGALSVGAKRAAQKTASDIRVAETRWTLLAYALTSVSVLLFAATAWI